MAVRFSWALLLTVVTVEPSWTETGPCLVELSTVVTVEPSWMAGEPPLVVVEVVFSVDFLTVVTEEDEAFLVDVVLVEEWDEWEELVSWLCWLSEPVTSFLTGIWSAPLFPDMLDHRVHRSLHKNVFVYFLCFILCRSLWLLP